MTRGSAVEVFAGIAVAVAVVGTFGVAPPTAWADDDSTGGEVREITPLSFGLIGRPALGSNTLDLHWQNNNVTIGGSGDGFHLGEANSGRYLLRGQGYSAVTVTVQIANFSADGLVVEEVYLNGPTNTYSTTLDGDGVFMGRLGGVVRIETDATPGLHETDLLMTLDYE